jgi:hypothetical protein
MDNRWRQFRYQVQQRDSQAMIAEYQADGVPEYAQTEWVNRLKKSYPMKSAHRELEYCIREMGRSQDLRLIDTKTMRVIHNHTGAK